MHYLLAALFGVVEGLTEFLPVSSTAHLRILKPLFHIPLDDPYWKMFDIVIQLGAILCLPVYFFDRLKGLLMTFPHGEKNDKTVLTHPLTLVMIAFVVTAVPLFFLKKKVSANLENLTVIGSALLIGGAIMWAVDALFGPTGTKASIADLAGVSMQKQPAQPDVEYEPATHHEKTTRVEKMSIGQAVWIGACQILSGLFPGTSRSMSTIAGAQIAGMTRASALEFSFFLSIPTMCVATLFDLWKTIHPGKDLGKDAGEHLAPLSMNGPQWVMLLIGFVVSFIVALGVVAWFMNWVRRRGFAPFAIYRIILGLVVLLLLRSHPL